MALQISSLSLQYVRVQVTAMKSGVGVDPSSDPVQMAFPSAGVAPVGGDWNTAAWEKYTTTSGTTYWAICLVGPGGTKTLTAGRYDVWVKVTDSPEVPVEMAGQLLVT